MIESILHISDTHGLHRATNLTAEADVMVHSGNFTMTGTAPEVIDFAEWLCGVRVSGNTTFVNGAMMTESNTLNSNMKTIAL